MNFDMVASMRELRFLGARMTRLASEKDALVARNVPNVNKWPIDALEILENLLVDMAATRARQSKLLKICAADVHTVIWQRKGAP